MHKRVLSLIANGVSMLNMYLHIRMVSLLTESIPKHDEGREGKQDYLKCEHMT